MSTVNPAPRRRIRPAAAPVTGPTTVDRHDLFDPYDGPAPLEPVRDNITQQLVQPQRSLPERLTIIARFDRDEAETLTLQTLHQFIIAKTPSDVICQRMGMSFRALRTWRQKLSAKLKEDSKTRDPHDFIGPMVAEMEEIKAQAWRDVAAAPSKDAARRLAGLNTVLKANAEIARLLQVAGLFDNQPLRQPLTNTDETDGGASVLKAMAENFLTGGYAQNQKYRQSPTPGDVIIDGDA